MEHQDARAEGPQLEHSHFVLVQPGAREPGRAPLHVQGQDRGHRTLRELSVHSDRPSVRLEGVNRQCPRSKKPAVAGRPRRGTQENTGALASEKENPYRHTPELPMLGSMDLDPIEVKEVVVRARAVTTL